MSIAVKLLDSYILHPKKSNKIQVLPLAYNIE